MYLSSYSELLECSCCYRTAAADVVAVPGARRHHRLSPKGSSKTSRLLRFSTSRCCKTPLHLAPSSITKTITHRWTPSLSKLHLTPPHTTRHHRAPGGSGVFGAANASSHASPSPACPQQRGDSDNRRRTVSDTMNGPTQGSQRKRVSCTGGEWTYPMEPLAISMPSPSLGDRPSEKEGHARSEIMSFTPVLTLEIGCSQSEPQTQPTFPPSPAP